MLDAARARERRARHENETARTDASPEDPLENAATREAVARLAAAIERLAPRQREIVRRFYALGESIANIAQAMELPPGTVKSDLHRARVGLAKRVHNDEATDTNRGDDRE